MTESYENLLKIVRKKLPNQMVVQELEINDECFQFFPYITSRGSSFTLTGFVNKNGVALIALIRLSFSKENPNLANEDILRDYFGKGLKREIFINDLVKGYMVAVQLIVDEVEFVMFRDDFNIFLELCFALDNQ